MSRQSRWKKQAFHTEPVSDSRHIYKTVPDIAPSPQYWVRINPEIGRTSSERTIQDGMSLCIASWQRQHWKPTTHKESHSFRGGRVSICVLRGEKGTENVCKGQQPKLHQVRCVRSIVPAGCSQVQQEYRNQSQGRALHQLWKLRSKLSGECNSNQVTFVTIQKGHSSLFFVAFAAVFGWVFVLPKCRQTLLYCLSK